MGTILARGSHGGNLMKLAIMVFGAALLAGGCRTEPSDHARDAEKSGINGSTELAGKDDRVIDDKVQEKAPGARDGDGGPDGAPPPGAQPQLNPEAQDPKGRGPRDPRMVPGSPASEQGLTIPPNEESRGSQNGRGSQGEAPKR